MTDWYRDNERIRSVSVNDRALHYGDGLFETIAIRSGELRFWPLHMQRLQSGCERLGITAPDTDSLRALVDNALNATEIDTEYALAKLIVSGGVGPRGYRRAPSTAVEAIVGVYSAEQLPKRTYQDGVRVIQCDTRLGDQPKLAGLKTLNRLEQVLARNEWDDPEIFEGLMCDSSGRVICGTMSNVFAIYDNSINTPKLSLNGVAGVMRRHIMDTLRRADIPVHEEPLPQQIVLAADAVFLSNSQFAVIPVSHYGEHQFAGNDLYSKVTDLLARSGVVECEL